MEKIFENRIYRQDKDLIKGYNSFMELLPNDGWAAFVDADILYLDSFYGDLFIEAIADNPDTSCFTCMTNRIGNPYQLYNEYVGDDITKHRAIAKNLREKYRHQYIDFPYNLNTISTMSGMVMLLKKSAWKDIDGFKEWKPNYSKILGVDNKLHQDLHKFGHSVKIIKSMYVYHWYRGGTNDVTHLK